MILCDKGDTMESRLTLIKIVGKSKCRAYIGLYRCVCGNEKKIRMSFVRSGKTKSCGCLQRGKATKHGMEGTPEYHAWSSMKKRCNLLSDKGYKRYGGRGIKVCDRWMESFENFYEDMGNRPSMRHSLDRINNNKGYSKENCRWATATEQANNRRSTVMIEGYGVTQSISMWENTMEIPKGRITARLIYGWSKHDAVFLPRRSKKPPVKEALVSKKGEFL